VDKASALSDLVARVAVTGSELTVTASGRLAVKSGIELLLGNIPNIRY
jgi:hypothetical protein